MESRHFYALGKVGYVDLPVRLSAAEETRGKTSVVAGGNCQQPLLFPF